MKERKRYRDNKRSVYCFPSALLSNLKVYLSSALAFWWVWKVSSLSCPGICPPPYWNHWLPRASGLLQNLLYKSVTWGQSCSIIHFLCIELWHTRHYEQRHVMKTWNIMRVVYIYWQDFYCMLTLYSVIRSSTVKTVWSTLFTTKHKLWDNSWCHYKLSGLYFPKGLGANN